MAGGGRGTGTAPAPAPNSARMVRDKAGNLWRWYYDKNGNFQRMEYYEKQDPPAVRWWDQAQDLANTGGDFIDWLKTNWKAAVIAVICIFVLTRKG